MKIALFFHLLGVAVWIGGMFFAYLCLRPVAGALFEPAQRLRLWVGVFSRFFPWVWLSVASILGSGVYLLYLVGERYAPLYVYVMAAAGILMMLIFAHLWFAPYRRLKRAVQAEDWPAGGRALAQIRIMVGTNLALGLLVITVATLGAMV
jgi:uncharacterized membrane protein